MELTTPLVSSEWLEGYLRNSKIVILDASLPKPKTRSEDNPLFNLQIEGANFFDIDHVFSDTSANLPHTMLSAEDFTKEAQLLGINSDSQIIIYDNIGIYSSPRAWWMFRAMGHENVAILDGGLPDWIKRGLPTEAKKPPSFVKGDFNSNPQLDYFKDSQAVLKSIEDSNSLVIDARSAGRFAGTAPEPRTGLRGGHIPNSVSLPFEDVIYDGKMKSTNELTHQFQSLNIADKQLIFSCGSGLTACIIALAADLAGYKKLSVYDGSWSEWGGTSDLPVINF